MISSIFKTRVSIRKYQDRPVEEDKVRMILRAAMQAPSACNQQPWEFYVVTDKSAIKKLAADGIVDQRSQGFAALFGDRYGSQRGEHVA